MMKTLRKSLNAHKESISHPAPPALSKPSTAVQPPKKVIRALSSYKSRAPQELSFEKGDFFHVLNDVNNGGVWFEAHNPMTGSRGLVPAAMFEEFHKGAASPRITHAGDQGQRPMSTATTKLPVYYAMVMHDFIAERPDELDAKAGDAITVVAQSNREWFVAKPIGRLGRPGLIPVAFVELRDPATGAPVKDVYTLIDGGALPRVEEWKRAMMTYKANSIALGVLEESRMNGSQSPSPVSPVQEPAYMKSEPPMPAYVQGYQQPQPPQPSQLPQPSQPPQQPSQKYQLPQQHQPTAAENIDPLRPETPNCLPEGILLSADVKSFHYEMDEYWFRIHAIFQPYDPSGSNALPTAKQLVLFRSYNDFYDFQVELLATFPLEAGRPDVSTRILPYMPGPAEHVDDEITVSRRVELDEYLHRLCDLQNYASYILEHRHIRNFLALKPGDAEVEIEPRTQEMEALARLSTMPDDERTDLESEVDQISRMHLSDKLDEHASDGSDYGNEEADGLGRGYDAPEYRSSSQMSARLSNGQTYQGTQPLRVRPRSPVDARGDLAPPSSYGRSPSLGSGTTKQQALVRALSNGTNASGRLPEANQSHTSLEIDPYYDSHHNGTSSQRSSNNSSAPSHNHSPVSMRSSQANSVATSQTSLSNRSRSQSNATYNPPISATNQQPAFIKIKVFDRTKEDLIAIRVHPQVTHAQLLDKVQQRLGQNTLYLRYRDSNSNQFVNLMGDNELRTWLDITDKHILYAE